MTSKTGILKQYANQAKEADRRHDISMRNQWANQWREMATEAQAKKKKAPAYLTWAGRKGEENRWQRN